MRGIAYFIGIKTYFGDGKLKKGILFSIALIGFTAIVAQIIFMREFLVVFYGNEIAIGIIFTSWFATGMLGSWLLGRFTLSLIHI